MNTIWKFGLEPTEHGATISMPRGATVLCVQEQGNAPQLWALVDSDAPQEQRVFYTFGTGHPLPKDVRHRLVVAHTLRYVGTFQLHAGALVFHVFEGPAS